MISFNEFPNKRSGGQTTDVWPDLGAEFMLNRFYRHFDGAEGWLGDSFLTVWSRQEVIQFRSPNREAYPEKYHFFGSNGGGTQFGFVCDNGGVEFCSAPDIGGEEDIRFLGDWVGFIQSLRDADYI